MAIVAALLALQLILLVGTATIIWIVGCVTGDTETCRQGTNAALDVGYWVLIIFGPIMALGVSVGFVQWVREKLTSETPES